MTNIVSTQIQALAKTLNMQGVDEQHLKHTLTNTVFKGANDEQLVTLMIVANQYKLNPFTKEIYAFPSKGGITPIVSVDGWARIINDNPLTDGIQFEQDADSCTCKIYRKDRTHPTIVTEYLDECKGTSDPWKKYPKRMLRHKALIQCARVAFGFSGIYDEDEAKRIDGDFVQAGQSGVVIDHDYEVFKGEYLPLMEQVASRGTQALQEAYNHLPIGEHKKRFWTEYSASLKQIAQQADLQAPQGGE